MWIDIHSHITYGDYPVFAKEIVKHNNFDINVLLRRLDYEGIDKSVLLALNNPEVLDRYGVANNQEILQAAKRYPDRIIPFCSVDPRSMLRYYPGGKGFQKILGIYRDLGVRGIGEVSGSIPVDDERYQDLFAAAGELSMPLIFHFQPHDGHSYGATDDLHFPGLERMLKMFPNTTFLGHSQSFWSEIAGDVTNETREYYGTKPYAVKGRLWHLFEHYDNIGGDISAGSGASAFQRDPEHTKEFFSKFHQKLYFGTDRFSDENEPIPPQIPLLKKYHADGILIDEMFENITHRNFERLMAKQK